ncbi:uncharacterized protein DFL_006820 [Arthrobotrys flagrans]|uniref:Uncharacterized protein n=1 Tax=Arthrobotrys flagrans TaxID=97331 RepID=A0A436ZTW7_ARTFL|nr:hypothetical protein DFL_006820 [Arthrobotrys flagrans]
MRNWHDNDGVIKGPFLDSQQRDYFHGRTPGWPANTPCWNESTPTQVRKKKRTEEKIEKVALSHHQDSPKIKTKRRERGKGLFRTNRTNHPFS